MILGCIIVEKILLSTHRRNKLSCMNQACEEVPGFQVLLNRFKQKISITGGQSVLLKITAGTWHKSHYTKTDCLHY